MLLCERATPAVRGGRGSACRGSDGCFHDTEPAARRCRVPLSLAIALSIPAVVLSWAGVYAFRRWAEQRGILDLPNERSSHTRPTPRGGGVVIAGISLAFGAVLAAGSGGAEARRLFAPYALGAVLVSAVSWLDDLRSLPRGIRLAIHAAAAAAAVAGLGFWETIAVPVLGPLAIGWLGPALALLWIVGLTNAYNFMDGIDGIAAGQAVAAGTGWYLAARSDGPAFVAGFALLVAAASLGFLLHNWSPARIFMGDVGSAFLGYTLAVMPIAYARCAGGSAASGAPWLGVLLVWPFVFDTGFTFVRRLLKGENVFEAHRSHLYQRLVAAGWSHARAAALYVGMACAGVPAALAWARGSAGAGAVSLALAAALASALWLLVILQERGGAQAARE